MTWIYELPDTDGEYYEVKRGSGDGAFEIPALTSVSQYARGADGYIEGHLRLSAAVDGRTVSASYDVRLSIVPKIVSAQVTEVTRSAEGGGFTITANINHLGSDYLSVVLEQEYDPGLRYQTINQPNSATVIYDNVSSMVYIWIDIEAVNSYGSDTYTIELDDEFITNNVK